MGWLRNESDAVTVDWVVLTAAIVGLGIVVLTSVSGGTTSLAKKISVHMEEEPTRQWCSPLGGKVMRTPNGLGCWLEQTPTQPEPG